MMRRRQVFILIMIEKDADKKENEWWVMLCQATMMKEDEELKFRANLRNWVSFGCLVNRLLFEGKWHKTMLNGWCGLGKL